MHSVGSDPGEAKACRHGQLADGSELLRLHMSEPACSNPNSGEQCSLRHSYENNLVGIEEVMKDYEK